MLPGGVFNTRYEQETAIVRTGAQWGLLIGFLALVLLAPLFLSVHLLSFFITMAIIIIGALGLQLVTGYCGQIVLGQAAFVAVGAYSFALLCLKLNVSPWLAIPIAGVITTSVGVIFGLPAVRVKGFYLAITTLAAQLIILYLISYFRELTGGPDGMAVPPLTIGNMVLIRDEQVWYVVMPITFIMIFIARNLVRSRFGRSFVAIRDNDIAASVLGINIFIYKLLAFAISSFFAGIAGSLFAISRMHIIPEQFTFTESVWYIAIIVVGGMGTITGVIFGAAVLEGLKEGIIYLGPIVATALGGMGTAATSLSSAMTVVVFGGIICLFVMFEPRGLTHLWEIIKRTYRLWPFPY